MTSGLAVFVAATALAGCGGSDDASPTQPSKTPAAVSDQERGILGAVDALQMASRKGDGRRICADIFTVQLVHSIETAAKHSCAEEVGARLFSKKTEISVGRDVQVTGARGTAVIREQNGNISKLMMLKQDGEWRIDRVVAQPSS
jgi:hypothetical protein